MRHLKRKDSLTLKQNHRRALLRNLIRAVFLNKQIVTTFAKAKTVQPLIERTISLASRGGLQAYRLVEKELHDQRLVKKAVELIAPHYKDKKGGYTRIIKLESRLGDNAPMAIIELIGDYVLKEEKRKKTPDKSKEIKEGETPQDASKQSEAEKTTKKKVVKKVVVGEGGKK